MAVSDALIDDWIRRIGSLDNVEMDPRDLVEDVELMSLAFADDTQYDIAMNMVHFHLQLVVKDPSLGRALAGAASGWTSFHFPSRRTHRFKADLRLVYRVREGVVQVRGFGLRYHPESIYRRVSSR